VGWGWGGGQAPGQGSTLVASGTPSLYEFLRNGFRDVIDPGTGRPLYGAQPLPSPSPPTLTLTPTPTPTNRQTHMCIDTDGPVVTEPTTCTHPIRHTHTHTQMAVARHSLTHAPPRCRGVEQATGHPRVWVRLYRLSGAARHCRHRLWRTCAAAPFFPDAPARGIREERRNYVGPHTPAEPLGRISLCVAGGAGGHALTARSLGVGGVGEGSGRAPAASITPCTTH
jgi:uncharacterized Zn-finger protein